MLIRTLPLALLALAACTTTSQATPPLTGSQWTFVTIDGAAPVSSKARLTIEANRIGANVGCNGMGGDLKIEGGRLVSSGIESTLMFCDGIMEQERAVTDLLGASPRYTIGGDRLVLESAKHRAELRRAK
ncbi:MAG: META domain-containing protein [Novosphingobium sp.]